MSAPVKVETRMETRVKLELSVEQAMALEGLLKRFGDESVRRHGLLVNELLTPVWDGLDDVRQGLMEECPGVIPLELREFRDGPLLIEE